MTVYRYWARWLPPRSLRRSVVAGALLSWLLVGLLLPSIAHSAEGLYPFTIEEQRQRYYQLLGELRCPKCQNQSLADSNAPIATDLRRELHGLLVEGYSDEDILAFMRERYGEFVLYDPPLNRWTVVLWLLPMGLLFIGLGLLFFMVRPFGRVGPAAGQAHAPSSTSRHEVIPDAATTISVAEQRRLDALLRESDCDD